MTRLFGLWLVLTGVGADYVLQPHNEEAMDEKDKKEKQEVATGFGLEDVSRII
jgi:hypothetical protein